MKLNGFKEALELLKNLDTESRNRIMLDMAKKDPALVAALKSKLISFEDLKNLTPAMMKDLLSTVDPYTLGVALRTEDNEIAEKLKTMMSKNNAQDLDDGKNQGLKSLTEVQKIQNEVLDKINKLVDQGKIIIKNDDSDEYV